MDATLSWKPSLSGTPTSYTVVWTYNGAEQPKLSVPVTANNDAAGYTSDFATANPTVVVKAGDVIGASVQAVDAAHSLASAVVVSTPPTVTEPTMPIAPGDPQNVTLVLS